MRRDQLWLDDMREHAREALRFTRGRTKQDMESDRLLELALARLVELVGEAAAQVSQETRDSIDLPWAPLISMRNRLIHAYHRIDNGHVWKAVIVHFPVLLQALDAAE